MSKAVLFDLFGTLIAPPSMTVYRQMVAQIAVILGEQFEKFNEPWMSINDGRLDGRFGSSEGDILAAAELVGAQVSDSQMAECMNLRRSITRDFLTPKSSVLEMLTELQSLEIKIGLVTDCVYDVPAVWPESVFAPYFSATHFSCVTHVRKPDARAYNTVLEELSVTPDSALFVGDGGSDELNGAVRAGIKAVMIDDLTPASGEVMRVGVVDWIGPVVTSMSQITKYVQQ
jgi:putative hydrolase of the HAD superfamily